MSMPDATDQAYGDEAFEEEDEKTTKLKAALWLPIGRLVDQITMSMGKNATPQFIGSLTELVWHQILNATTDVESFARHAGRTTITVDDVLLLARRSEALAVVLRSATGSAQT